MRILAVLVMAAFVAGCCHVPPGQIKKNLAPGQIKKVTGVNPMAASNLAVKNVKVKVK